MKLFTVYNKGKFVQFKEQDFQQGNKEIDLEILLENNPEYFFNDNKILIIDDKLQQTSILSLIY